MSGLLATVERELRAYFFSPLAYVILTFFLLVNGYVFALIVSFLSDPRSGGSTTPMEIFFGGFFFWLVLFFVTPVLTMRLLAEERRSGTIESLMTAPVTEIQVVFGKYLAALLFYLFLWAPTLIYVGLIARGSSIDWGPVASGYLGVVMIGAVFLAVGVFGSSFAKNQVVAAIITFAMLIFLFSITFVEPLVSDEAGQSVLAYMNLPQHMEDFGKGIVDSRRLIYYVTTVALFLFLSARALEVKKWR